MTTVRLTDDDEEEAGVEALFSFVFAAFVGVAEGIDSVSEADIVDTEAIVVAAKTVFGIKIYSSSANRRWLFPVPADENAAGLEGWTIQKRVHCSFDRTLQYQ